MKITIIVGGRFHAFNLAEELDAKGCLKQLITSYPKGYINKHFKIEIDRVISIKLKEILSRIPFLNNILSNKISNYFETSASKHFDPSNTDILIGWSGFSLKSFQKAKSYKCLKVLERGSTHIEFQKEILLKEYNLLKIKPDVPNNYIIKKEIQEYELADFISVPSEFAKNTFIERGIDKKKIIKIPYGVDIKQFNHDNLQNKKDDIFRIIYVGNCSVRKGIIYLLKAFAELNLDGSELLIVGGVEKSLYPRIKNYFKNYKIKHVKSQKQHNLKKYYNISKLFITCSLEEGLSMVQLQAMACGLPVISTVNAGAEEIVSNQLDGYILPIRDIEALKEKIKFLYQNQEVLKTMGRKAKEKSKNYFTWKDYGSKVISNYENLLKERIKNVK